MLTILLLATYCSLSMSLRPIILVSGLFGRYEEFTSVRNFVRRTFPDARISTVTEFYGMMSLTNLWTQVEETYNLIRPILASAPDGVTMICFGQGILLYS